MLTPTNGQTFFASFECPPCITNDPPCLAPCFLVGPTVTICADARDEDGYVDYVEFFAGTNKFGARTNCLPCASIQNPFCFTWLNVPPGEYSLTAKATDNHGAATVSELVRVVVRSDEPRLPVVTIEAPHPNASETPGHPGLFYIYRTGPTNHPLTVFWEIGGTAGNGVDYATLSNLVVIPAGRSFVRVAVVPMDDDLVEAPETVRATLYYPPFAGPFPPTYAIGSPSNATVTIFDNDPALPPFVRIFSPTNGTAFTAPANIQICATASEYVATVEFFAGDTSLGVVTNSCHPPDCAYVMPPQYCVDWSNVPPGLYTLTAKATDIFGATSESAPVHISVFPGPHPDQSLVTILARDAIASEGTNCFRWAGWPNPPPANYCGTNTATFVVRRHGPTNDALSVWYAVRGTASNGVDYAELPGIVTIPAGRRAAEVIIVPVDDGLPERHETVVLGLVLPPVGPDVMPAYTLGIRRRAGAVIVDNDRPRPISGFLPDRDFHFTQPGTNGAWYRVETSTNLIHWTALVTNVVTDGAIHFVDPDAAGAPARFYRAVPETNAPPE
jgi:hypothetical protein